jgi:hypothetical protein
MTDKKNKVYGLILSKKADLKNAGGEKKPSIFNDDSSDDDIPTDWRKKSLGGTNLNRFVLRFLKTLILPFVKMDIILLRVKKQTQSELSRALEQDPTVFQVRK